MVPSVGVVKNTSPMSDAFSDAFGPAENFVPSKLRRSPQREPRSNSRNEMNSFHCAPKLVTIAYHWRQQISSNKSTQE
jgi:hypothetical protein